MRKAIPIIVLLGVALWFPTYAQQSVSNYYQTGGDLLNKNNYKEAEMQFSLGLDLCENQGQSSSKECIAMRFNRAFSYSRTDQFLKADSDLDIYFSLTEGEAGDYDLRGEVKLELKDYKGAVAAFSKAIEILGDINSVYLGRAKANLQRRYLQEARRDVDIYLEQFPNDFNGILLKGDIEYYDSKYGIARNYYEKALSINPASIEAINNIANTHKEEGNCDEALDYYSQVIRIKPNSPFGYCNRALCKMKFMKYDEAESDLEEARRTNKSLDQINYINAKLQLIRGRYKDAISSFDEILLINPDFHDAYLGKSEAYIKLKDYKNALIAIKKGLEKDDQNPAYKSMLGLILILNNDIKGGIAILDEILRKIPNYSMALAYRGLAHYKIKKDAKANKDFQAAIEANPYNVQAMYHWAILLKNDDVPQALNKLNDAISYHPNYVEARLLRAEIKGFLGGTVIDIIREYELIVEIQPFLHYAYYQKGRCHYKLKDYKNALDAFNRAASHSNDNDDLYYLEIGETLMILAKEKGNSDEAIDDLGHAKEAFDRALNINKSVSALRGRGMVHMQLGDMSSALTDFQNGLSFVKDDNERQRFYALQGRVYYQKGNYDKAVDFFTKANAISDQYIDNLYWFGMAYLAKGEAHWRDAKIQFNRAIELTDLHEAHPFRAELHMQRGILNANDSEFQEAIEDFDISIDLDPNNIVYLENRGLAYQSIGAFSDALSDYSRIVRLDERNFRAYFLKGKMHNRLKEYMAAVLSLSKSISDKNVKAEYYHERGVAYFNLKNEASAVQDFMQAIGMQGEHYSSYAYLGRIHSSQEKHTKALDFYDKAITGLPNNPVLRKDRGDAYYKLNQYARAVEDYELAIRLKLSDGVEITYLRKGHCYRHMEKFKEAVKDFDTVLAMAGNYQGQAYHGRGLTYYGKNDLDKAIQDFNEAEPLVKEDLEMGILYFNRGSAYRKKGMQSQACSDYDRSSNLGFAEAKKVQQEYCN